MSAELLRRAEAAFDAAAWRDALLAFEAVWHADRDEGTRALVLLCNALLQLERGMSTAPRRALQRADDLLRAAAPTVAGYDVARLRQAIGRVRAAIPPDLETGAGQLEWAAIPRFTLAACRQPEGANDATV